ncbi:MAG: hypothetical protein JWO82_2563, partial [Akkermansiaceae bacterium]|nr:hypothetical protein [Akkermansiaceae bacterium]
MKSSILRLTGLTTVMLTGPVSAIDGNANSQSDVWEMVFGAAGLPPGGDADHDGWTNAQESIAGTNPFDPGSRPQLQITSGATPVLWWQSFAGKRYTVYSSQDLVTWAPAQSAIQGNGQTVTWPIAPPGGRAFFRLQAEDQDSDGDGLSDWEELTLGLDPTRPRTERYEQTDSQRVASQLALSSTIDVAVYEDFCAEGWPAPAILVLRRSGGLAPLSVHVQFSGSATPATDYTSSISGTTVPLAAGQREAFVEI